MALLALAEARSATSSHDGRGETLVGVRPHPAGGRRRPATARSRCRPPRGGRAARPPGPGPGLLGRSAHAVLRTGRPASVRRGLRGLLRARAGLRLVRRPPGAPMRSVRPVADAGRRADWAPTDGDEDRPPATASARRGAAPPRRGPAGRRRERAELRRLIALLRPEPVRAVRARRPQPRGARSGPRRLDHARHPAPWRRAGRGCGTAATRPRPRRIVLLHRRVRVDGAVRRLAAALRARLRPPAVRAPRSSRSGPG